MSYESRQAIIKAEEQLKQLGKELELDRYLRVDDDPYPSKRVFKLLKNLDLENVSFSNVQSAGNPMHIEKLNRQELFDLVLVNFARLCVENEWDGLLTAGGGGGTQYAFDPIDASLLPATYSRFAPMDVYRVFSTSTVSTNMEPKAMFMRFIAPKSGTMDQMTIRTSGTNTAKDDVSIGIYESSSGLPTNRIGDITIDVNGGSALYSSSDWNTKPELTAGDTMWIGFVPDGTDEPALSTAHYNQFLCLGLTHYPGAGYTTLYNTTGTSYEMPSTVDLDVILPANNLQLFVWSFKYA